MDKQQKADIILEVAKAYYNRGAFIQYDQRSLDRVVQLTPRPGKLFPPEAATREKTVFLDCSSFVNTVYYQAFGYLLSADLTWHMIDYVKPRIFYYELTHNETRKDISEIEKKIRELIEPGDVITYDRGVGSGHTLMYTGDDKFIHCTSNGRPDSYDYVNKKSREYEDGGIFIQDISVLFEPDDGENVKKGSLFCRNNRRFAVARPLDIMGEPTENAIARTDRAKDLLCEVTVSRPGGQHISYGEKAEYTVFVRNLSCEEKNVEISFQESTVVKKAGAGKTISAAFLKEVRNSEEKPKVTVNTLDVFVPEILVGNSIDGSKLAQIITIVCEKLADNASAVEAAAYAYGKFGIEMDNDEQKNICNSFYLHDSTKGDVLSRKRRNNKKDCGVDSLFGGYGVITPEIVFDYGIRCNKIQRRDLMPGDIILCSDDPYGVNTYSSFYTGDKLIGRFDAGNNAECIENSDIDVFIDSLFGRFCFVILRPYM